MNSSSIFSSPDNLGFIPENAVTLGPKTTNEFLHQHKLESILKQPLGTYSSLDSIGVEHHFRLCLDRLTPLSLVLGSETHEVFHNAADGSVILSEELEGRADEVHQALRHQGYEGVKLVFINSALLNDLSAYIRNYQAAQATKNQEQNEKLETDQKVEPAPPTSRRPSFEVKNHSLTEEEWSLLLYMARIKITHISENVLFAEERTRKLREQEKQEQRIELLKTEQLIIEAGEKEAQDTRIHESIKQNGTRTDAFRRQQIDTEQP